MAEAAIAEAQRGCGRSVAQRGEEHVHRISFVLVGTRPPHGRAAPLAHLPVPNGLTRTTLAETTDMTALVLVLARESALRLSETGDT
ncbi:hypothetical protein TPA0598_03_00310 [Streptomyces lydicamycinicus]|uniref:Uncharacterized protein n=1 Tax=Streptomyces lydicamycinicus TaxID=1546107 RepID=A0A0P4R3W3_9ACTN|nr:hypothetical protein TPA0598_03_00310 [Streptomyces lydicamycinicus]